MNRKITRTIISLVILYSGLSYAHHSFFAVFNGDELVTVKGTVTEFRMVNPHAMMYLEVAGENGAAESWSVEFDGRLHLGRAGWRPDTFMPGETLEVTGYPAHSGANMMFFNNSVDADGEMIRRPRLDLEDSIEEQRRLRREQRQAQN